jgi:hypothetical protein
MITDDGYLTNNSTKQNNFKVQPKQVQRCENSKTNKKHCIVPLAECTIQAYCKGPVIVLVHLLIRFPSLRFRQLVVYCIIKLSFLLKNRM